MKTTINPIPHADKPRVTIYEWLVRDQRNNFVAGGYADTREAAAQDLRRWRELNAGPFSQMYWRALTSDNRDFNFLTRAKAEAFAAKCGGYFVGRATRAEMNEIFRAAGVLKPGETCR